MGTRTDPCPRTGGPCRDGDAITVPVPGWGSRTGMGARYRRGNTYRDGDAITGPVPGWDALYQGGELVPGWRCCNGTCTGIGGSVPGWGPGTGMGVPFGMGDPYRYLSWSVIRCCRGGPVPAHRLDCGVASQNPYWIGMSCTGMGPGTSVGCPVLGWEVPFQRLYWDGGAGLEWGVLYRNGGPHMSPCTGMRVQHWLRDPVRELMSGWELGTGMGSCAAGAWGSVPCWGQRGDTLGVTRVGGCCERSRCGISGCCCTLGELLGMLECAGRGTAGATGRVTVSCRGAAGERELLWDALSWGCSGALRGPREQPRAWQVHPLPLDGKRLAGGTVWDRGAQGAGVDAAWLHLAVRSGIAAPAGTAPLL